MRTDLDRITVFVGAEIAAAAGLPTADELAAELLDALVLPRWASAELTQLTLASSDDGVGDEDHLRVELLLLWVAEVFDEDLGFFAFLDEVGRPAPVHRRVAAAAVRGARVLTTNVDDLLEQAVIGLGSTALTIDAHSGQPPPTAGPAHPVTVVKLRGTRHVHASGQRRPVTGARLTSDAIAAAGPRNPANKRVEALLADAVTDRDLVIVGSTATDELDVLPVLAGTRPRSVTWVEVSDSSVEVADSSVEVAEPAGANEASSAAARIASAWQRAGVDVTVVRGLLDAALDIVGLPSADCSEVDEDVHTTGPPWRERIRSWVQEIRDEDPTGLGLATLLLAEVGQYDSAERALEESEPSPRPGTGWSRARRLYERAQMTLLRPNGDPELAYRLGLEALAAARADPGAGMEINCHIVLGRTALVRCQPDEALPHFERALAKSPQGSNDRAVAASWIGRTKLWGKGDPLGARPPLRQAIMLLRLQGEQEGLIDALQALGIAESTLGQHVLAVRLFAEARDIARSLSLPDQQLAAMQALADCQFTWGDLAAARAEVTTIVGNASLAECNEVSMAWSLLAAIELEDGDFGAARNAAEEALATCTTWTINNIAEVWALLAEVEWLDGRPDEAQRAAHTALLQPDHDSTWWARARAEAVLAGASGDHGPLARALAPQVNLLTGPQLLVAARSLRRLGIDTAQSRRLSERAHKHASRIGAGHWL